MDRQSAKTLATYRKGEFERAAALPLTPTELARGAHSANLE
jgi:hypothetical protein